MLIGNLDLTESLTIVERKMLRTVKQQKYSFLDIISFSYVHVRAGVYSISGLFHVHSD